MAHKLTSWFITEKGRKFTFGVVCATSIGICGAYTIPHTFLLEKYKEIIQLYKHGIPVKVPQPILNRFNKAAELLELPDLDKNRIKPFMVFGFDIFNAGTIYSKFGGIIGLPNNFTYTIDKVDKSDILVDNEPVDWTSVEGKQLMDSLVLSENAQIFAIAREMLYINSMKLFLDTFYASSVFVFMYGLANNLNKKLLLYSRPVMLRGSLYSIIGSFGFGIFAFLTDFTQNHFDMKLDKDLREKHEIFAEGGKEFYEKTIERNIALRKLLGAYGERIYSPMGNENFFIRQKRLPLVVRKQYFVNEAKTAM